MIEIRNSNYISFKCYSAADLSKTWDDIFYTDTWRGGVAEERGSTEMGSLSGSTVGRGAQCGAAAAVVVVPASDNDEAGVARAPVGVVVPCEDRTRSSDSCGPWGEEEEAPRRGDDACDDDDDGRDDNGKSGSVRGAEEVGVPASMCAAKRTERSRSNQDCRLVR